MHIVTEKAKHFCGDPELLAHRMTCRGVPGCSVALLQGGQVTHSAVSGAAGAAPVTEGTLFECASLTKPLFAVLALQLADEGLLTVEDVPSHGRERSLRIRIPPLGGVILKGRSRRPAEPKDHPPPHPQPQLRLAGLAQPPYAHALCPGYGL